MLIFYQFKKDTKLLKFEKLAKFKIPGDSAAAANGFSKYEEYEMRPIKGLDEKVQVEMYGSLHQQPASTNKRPQPLKKRTGPTSKHEFCKVNEKNVSSSVKSNKKHAG